EKNGQLIIVEGEAGSGKTVLMSSLFYELQQLSKTNENILLDDISCHLLVNHDQQLKIYQQIATKLGIFDSKKSDIVSKPTHFINTHTDRKSTRLNSSHVSISYAV